MKKIVTIVILSIILCLAAKGQWYTRKYGAMDIRELSDNQLYESLYHYKYITLGGCGAFLLGGLMILAGSTMYKDGLPDEPTFMEQLLGANTIRVLYRTSGAIVTAGGIAATFTGLSRSNGIRGVLDERRSVITMRPALLGTNYNSVVPGICISIGF